MSDETPELDVQNSSEDGEASEFEALNREIAENPGSPSFPRLAEAYRRAGQVERAESIAKQGLAQTPERLGGRVALALAMLDKGEITLATQELARIMENVPEVPHESPEVVSTAGSGAESAEEGVELAGELHPGCETTSGEHRLYCEPLAARSDVLPDLDNQPGDRFDDRSDGELGHELDERGGDEDSPGAAIRQEEIDDAFDSAQTEADQMISANRLAEAALRDVGEPDETYTASEHPVFATETMAGLLEGQGDREGAHRIRASIPGENASSDLETGSEATTIPEVVTSSGVATPSGVATSFGVATLPGVPIDLDAATLPTVPAAEGAPESPQPTQAPGEESGGGVSDIDAARRARIIQRLESWLANIRRDVA